MFLLYRWEESRFRMLSDRSELTDLIRRKVKIQAQLRLTPRLMLLITKIQLPKIYNKLLC